MTFRIKFAKFGVVRYIGHLDVMRYFQKVIRRSGLPVSYSQGFSPHQLMSFALPLGVGITSDGEYMEVEFDEEALKRAVFGADNKTSDEPGTADENDEVLKEKYEKFIYKTLSQYTTEGFEVLDVMQLPRPKPNVHQDKAMALVSAADYLIRVRDGYESKVGFDSPEAFYKAFEDFLSRDTVSVTRKTKKSEKELNLKEFIYDYSDSEGPGCAESAAHARSFANGMQLFVRLAAGSVMNIKPDLLLEAFMSYCGREYDENAFAIHRCELYMGTEGNFTALIP